MFPPFLVCTGEILSQSTFDVAFETPETPESRPTMPSARSAMQEKKKEGVDLLDEGSLGVLTCGVCFAFVFWIDSHCLEELESF